MERVQINFSGKVKVIVKPSSSKTELGVFDVNKKAWRVSISARAEDNKANIELIKFFTKLSKKKVRIVSGLSSRVKFLEFL